MTEQVRFEAMDDRFVPDIADIYNYYIRNSTATFHTGELGIEDIKGIIYTGDPRFPSYAMLEGDTVVGYGILTHFKKREAYDGTAEVTVYLKPGCEGRGLGTRALEHLEKTARTKDFHVLLAVICGENGQSIGLFRKFGYTECACYREVGRKFGRLLDVVCYQKIL